jgi:exopolyphosphatase/guanosine-5'-triphosphate,3'-diphosphate pyrophosphatase
MNAIGEDQKETSHLEFGDKKIIAFIDIGTNSLRLLLVRINPNSSYTILSDQKEVVRLGEGEFVDQFLHTEAMRRATLVAQKFANMARSYRSDQIYAVATSATREAVNQDEFLRHLKREAQLDIRVVSGLEEARLIYLGVSSGVHLGEEQGLFIDIGGGSTEVIVGDQTQYAHLDSLKLGAIRLTSLFFLPNETDPVPPARYALIQQYVRNATVRTVQRVHELPFSTVFGSSGTIENLADIAAQHFFNRKRERDDTFTHEQISQVASLLCSLPLDERRDVPGINPGRADIIVAGAAILETLMEDLEITNLHVSDRGLRDGLLVDYLARHDQSGLMEEASVRRRSVLQLGRACGVDEDHARNVAHLSLELFDNAREIKLHDMGNYERELLEYSALIHDVGSFLSYSNHHLHTYYLIRNADLLGFDQKEIIIMANAGRYHRKAMPKKKKHPGFASLDKRSQNTVRVFAILLRLAESMDRSHTRAISHANFRNGEENSIILSIQADHDPQLELWGVQNHRANFQKVFKRKLIVETEIENES